VNGYYHLDLLGVDNAYQGKGIGGALLRSLMQKIDEEGHACYLETAKKANVKIYKKQGFLTLFRERICGEGPYMRYMKVNERHRDRDGE